MIQFKIKRKRERKKNNNHVINKHMVCVPMGRGYVQNKNDCNE